jgi:hypothetical protein
MMSRMTETQITFEAKELARVVVLSLKDEKSVSAWLRENGDYYPSGDRVVRQALIIVRKTLRSEGFDLAKYKVRHKPKKN